MELIRMSDRTFNAAIAGAFTAALALSAVSAQAAGEDASKEKCYGIAKAGHNDCASTGNTSCAGTAKADYEKAAWAYVPKGTCLMTEVTLKNGKKRQGSLEPIKG
jgi:uncharacterized membrane protein